MRRAIEWAILAGGVASLALAVTATVARAENPGAQIHVFAAAPGA